MNVQESPLTLSSEHQEQALQVAQMIKEANRVVAVTGAGMSTASGLPDFRSENGIWSKHDPVKEGSIQSFYADPTIIWKLFVDPLVGSHLEPNLGHQALANMQKAHLLDALITQNIDGLDIKAGATPIEIHGSLTQATCLDCGKVYDMDTALQMREKAVDHIARCECGSPLKPNIIMFGELLDMAKVNLAISLSANCNLMLVCGSSLQVSPVSTFPYHAHYEGAKVIVINQGPTEFDHKALMKIEAPLDLFLDEVWRNLLTLGI